jgi:hypothetical protein
VSLVVTEADSVSLTVALTDSDPVVDTVPEGLMVLEMETVALGDVDVEAVRGVGAGSDTLGVIVVDVDGLTVVESLNEMVEAILRVYALLMTVVVDEGDAAETEPTADTLFIGLVVCTAEIVLYPVDESEPDAEPVIEITDETDADVDAEAVLLGEKVLLFTDDVTDGVDVEDPLVEIEIVPEFVAVELAVVVAVILLEPESEGVALTEYVALDVDDDDGFDAV